MPEAAMDDSPHSDANIEIRLGRPQQLFNSFDPRRSTSEISMRTQKPISSTRWTNFLQKRLRLIIHLPLDQLQAGNMPDLRQAIHNYFAYRLNESRRRLRLFFRDGRIALFIGLAFLFACTVLREFAFRFGPGAPAEIASEKACSLPAGLRCRAHWRSFSTIGARSVAAVRFSPSSPRSP
jgi:hypothetical protein